MPVDLDQLIIYPTLWQLGPFQEFLHINVVEKWRNKVQAEHDEGSRLHSGQVAKLRCATQMAHDLPHKKVFRRLIIYCMCNNICFMDG